MYEVIVLGATFAAAGIAHIYKEKCLVLERRLQAGYEFFGALQFGSDYDKTATCDEALQLQTQFLQGGTGVYGCDAYIYPYLQQCRTVFGAQLVSVEKNPKGFRCVIHGVSGFYSFEAKKIIDTRCNAHMCTSKTYNLLIESEEVPAFSGICCEEAPGKNRYILRLPVPLSQGYVEARAMARDVIARFSASQRLILSANEFDYRVKKDYPKTEDGIVYLPSKAYGHPILAFQAGITLGEEVGK